MKHRLGWISLCSAPFASAATDRVVTRLRLEPDVTVVVAEGDFEPRSIGSFSVRAYRADSAAVRHGLDTDDYLGGLVFFGELSRQKWIELTAVAFNLLYTILYLNSESICFCFGILGSLLFFGIYLKQGLYAETGLQVLYVILAIYAWMVPLKWEQAFQLELNHPLICLFGFISTWALAKCLKRFRRASLLYADSFVTITAVIGTVLMILYVEEGWLYLLASNVVALMICVSRRLFLAVAMYAVYILMSVDGYWNVSLFY